MSLTMNRFLDSMVSWVVIVLGLALAGATAAL